ncbi:GH92 family glycosyl hydrolase [Reichenbachiella ulvae]|uniref:GH92 family glycosyl hydrolase n=1 Tax=Reichenbachiella ulvae TaxID=2980104 RepID=A0ABT3CNG8_9BACT|nr:GH92 family glycosyl hydrolase [Reichenbachiella ulvae]MCV9385255.1 GH92 family glycosyl hydrolase [Reichenbachiella ulvae]
MKKICSFSAILYSIWMMYSCQGTKAQDQIDTVENQTNFVKWVNPFIGTGGHGHTFPGATVPNGMVQLSPDTRLNGWDACSGYHISDESILGFSHTHLSGTGIGDYGDILFMPFSNSIEVVPNDDQNYSSNYAAKKRLGSEVSSPGYYHVTLDEDDIDVELTASTRAGFHRYRYDQKNAGMIIDLNHTLQNHKQVMNKIEVVSKNEIRGVKKTQGWARQHSVYFHAVFSAPFEYEELANGDIAKLTFEKNIKEVLVKVGISHVDMEGAKKNLDQEIIDWSFDKTKNKAIAEWEKYLSVIEIEGGNQDQRTIFYTALYHTGISPNIFNDVDGRYIGMDREIHQSSQPVYTVYSIWDTYRALHPLNTIIRPKVNQEMIQSLIMKYKEGGILPKWELAANYTGTMTGYHAVSLIADAYTKGQRDFDIETAYEAMVHASQYDSVNVAFVDRNIQNKLMPKAKKYNNKKGYIPSDLENESVSKALEFAYNDWCIAQMAKGLNKHSDYKYFMARSKRYAQYFDPETGFMRGKLSNGEWREPFDPKYSNHRNDDYVEGNAWQWSWFVPHDVKGLVSLHGGSDQFVEKLDQLFSESSELHGDHVSSDISGLIGQYAHGNEPSHHIVYMYNYLNEPNKTQELTYKILSTLYSNDPDGLAGNEDCGQMSAWYVMSAMGIYQIAPGNPYYTFGSPIFDQVTIHLENGNQFVIKSNNNTAENIYLSSYQYNGEKLETPFITHEQIEAGGTLTFEKTNRKAEEGGI